MKKSTLVTAILLAGMSTAIITPVYADDVTDPSSGCPTGCGCQNQTVENQDAPAPEPVGPATDASEDTSN